MPVPSSGPVSIVPSEEPLMETETAPPKAAERPSVGSESQAGEAVEQKVPHWREILERLERKNPALSGALVGSCAYKKGNYVLIDCQGDLFLKLMRENEYARDCLKQAILEVTECGAASAPIAGRSGPKPSRIRWPNLLKLLTFHRTGFK